MTAAGISVIIPCHNDGAYLAEALRSVLAQSLPADEIIVIDDGSTDDSRNVAETFGEKLHFHGQPHQGIGSARNAGLRAARGRDLAFLDADDVWPPDSLEHRFAACELHPNNAASLGTTEEFLSPELTETQLATRLARGAVHVRLAGAMLVRREAATQTGGFDTQLAVGEWIDWIDRFGKIGLRIAELPELVLRRRIHAGNLASGIPAKWTDYLSVLRKAMQRRASPNEAAQ